MGLGRILREVVIARPDLADLLLASSLEAYACTDGFAVASGPAELQRQEVAVVPGLAGQVVAVELRWP